MTDETRIPKPGEEEGTLYQGGRRDDEPGLPSPSDEHPEEKEFEDLQPGEVQPEGDSDAEAQEEEEGDEPA